MFCLQYQNPYPDHDSHRKTDSPTLQKGINAISSSINYIGNAVEVSLIRYFALWIQNKWTSLVIILCLCTCLMHTKNHPLERSFQVLNLSF